MSSKDTTGQTGRAHRNLLYWITLLGISIRRGRLLFKIRFFALTAVFLVRRDIQPGARPGYLHRFAAKWVDGLGLGDDQLQQHQSRSFRLKVGGGDDYDEHVAGDLYRSCGVQLQRLLQSGLLD